MKNEINVFIVMLILNAISVMLGVVKTIFVAKKVGKPAYIIMFFDGIIYAFILKSFSSNSTAALLAYVFGRLLGLFLGNKLEDTLAVGVNDIELYVKTKATMLGLQAIFLEKGISSTAIEGTIDDKTSRYYLKIQIARKDMNEFYEALEIANIKNPTMTIKEVKRVTGNIESRINKNGKYKNC